MILMRFVGHALCNRRLRFCDGLLGLRVRVPTQRLSGAAVLKLVESLRSAIEQNRSVTERLVEQYEKRLEEKEILLEKAESEMAERLAKLVAVLANRIILDTGLRALYPCIPYFTVRYDRFVRDVVFDGESLSPAAAIVFERVAELCRNDVALPEARKELRNFAHNSSKGFHQLGRHLPRGIYCGGEQPTADAITILLALLQKEKALSGRCEIVNMDGMKIMAVHDGVVEAIGSE